MLNKRIKIRKIIFLGTLFSFLLLVQTLNSDEINLEKFGGCCQYNDKIIVNHSYNWSNLDLIKKLIRIDEDLIFSEKNDFSYIRLTNDSTAVVEWKRPSPALTKIFISENSEYIIGLSNIKYHNPYQLVVLNRKGEIIFRMHIAAMEAKLSHLEYKAFLKEYNSQNLLLKRKYRLKMTPNFVFIDFTEENMEDSLGKSCWEFLNLHSEKSHLSQGFSESEKKFVYWFKEPDPKLKFIFNGVQLERISLLDPKSSRFEIMIQSPEGGFSQKPIAYIPPVTPKYDVKLKCIDCPKEFSINEKINFKIMNMGEKLAIMFGIKVKMDDQWRILTYTATDFKIKRAWVFKKKESKIITWDKNMMITKDMMEEGNIDSRLLFRYVYYDISQGGEFLLYAWKDKPNGKELFRHEFKIVNKMEAIE